MRDVLTPTDMALLNRSETIRTLLCLVPLIILTGCIVTYREVPVKHSVLGSHTSPAPVACHQTVQFSYGQTSHEEWTWGGIYQWTYSGLFSPVGIAEILENSLQHIAGCTSAINDSRWPRTEVIVNVREKPYRWHWYGELLGRVSSQLYFLIPFYINEGGWEFSYRIHPQDKPTKTYQYDITARQFYWILLMPFAWVNFFTPSMEDAVRATTAQFLLDAQRDEYWRD